MYTYLDYIIDAIEFPCFLIGWADTPSELLSVCLSVCLYIIQCSFLIIVGVQTAMPDFHARFVNKLRSTQQVLYVGVPQKEEGE